MGTVDPEGRGKFIITSCGRVGRLMAKPLLDGALVRPESIGKASNRVISQFVRVPNEARS